jgi:hypothetical protein
MERTSLVVSRISRWVAIVGVFVTVSSHANTNGLVVYLSDYLAGDYYFAALPELVADASRQTHIQPIKMNLPEDFRRSVELGNHDVSRDGTEIVFAARTLRRKEWDIYLGRTDYTTGQINSIVRIVATRRVRDEDPRFDWSRDASGVHRVVYKCNGDICFYADSAISKLVEDSDCELWTPSFNSEGNAVSYVRRCGDSASDRIWYAYLNAPGNPEQVPLPAEEGGPDRFAHFQDAETLVYSHIMPDTGAASLWRYHSTTTAFEQLTFNTNTNSDDDPYPDKTNPNRIAYIGWQEGSGYNLFIYENGVSYKLSHNVPILAPAIFQIDSSPEPPNPPPSVEGVHIEALAVETGVSGGRWWSQVEVTVQDGEEKATSGVKVIFGTDTGDIVSCDTGLQGTCITERLQKNKRDGSVTYSVSIVDHPAYDASLDRQSEVTASRP